MRSSCSDGRRDRKKEVKEIKVDVIISINGRELMCVLCLEVIFQYKVDTEQLNASHVKVMCVETTVRCP